MKKLFCLLLALLMACAAFAEEEPTAMRIISCPEQGFSTLCRPDYTYDYHPDAGVTIWLGDSDDSGSVSMFMTDAPGGDFDADYYFNKTYLSLLESSYGSDLLNAGDYTTYTLSGREMPGRLSLYRDGSEVWMRFCAMDLREDCFVRYEAFCPGTDKQMEATLTAVAVAVGNFRPDADYYYQDEPEPKETEVPAPAPAASNSALDYVDNLLEDGSPIYYFEDLSLQLPASWRGRVMAMQEDGGVAFYQADSYRKYLEEGLEGGGFLFRLGASVNGSFSQLPAFAYLGFSERSAMNYYLELPTDYPAYNEPSIRAEYDAMCADVDFVVAHAHIYPVQE